MPISPTFFIDYELDQMSRYLTMTKQSLAEEVKKLESDFENKLDDDVEEEFLIDDYTDKFIELQQDYPKLVYWSFIVAWYSFIEQNLLDICESNNLRIVVTAKSNENLGRGIWRAKKFLSEFAGCEIDDMQWKELVSINRTRNFIVHDGYKLKGSYVEIGRPFVIYETEAGIPVYFGMEENLYKYLQKHSMLTHFDILLDVVPTFEYCDYLISFARNFFKDLYANLKTVRK